MRWKIEDNIKMDFGGKVCEYMDQIELE